jgi:cytochrome P450
VPPPAVDPLPPRVAATLPWVGAGFALLRHPTAFFARARTRHGDTFLVDAFGRRLFCVFSAAGVRRLYELPEADASKGLADFALLRLKIPDELVIGRRMRPHDLFGGEEVESYLDAVRAAVALEVAERAGGGTVDAFELGRRLGQRVGLACWAGAEAASPRYLERLLPLLDRLEASDAFVRPAQAFVTWATRKRRERAALRGVERMIGEILAERELRPGEASAPGAASAGGSSGGAADFLDRIAAVWSDASGAERVSGIARDVTLLHLGSQSNLPAALAWTLADVVARPDVAARVREGDDRLLERCASESIRLAQRSITLRLVRRPIEVDDGARRWALAPGVLLTTMLSVTNPTAAPGLDRWDPEHFDGRRLVEPAGLAARELVSTFGHGRHACPAQRFSISAIRIAVRGLLEAFDMTLLDAPAPRRRQLGGVARAEARCRIAYRPRAERTSRPSAGNTRDTLATR